ncbi:MnhB domain-containing protein [Methylocaldum szegediense]|uniref:Multicomponent Na+:H+ antiporter subunit B n=1 Tax=Methylocaldum szegediense TaxID=73780 RepID=A0ABM9HZX9_9GAMM|nr:MnhB domain-containing protein [Methylocaldum szegediense]CAI8798641.1 multicomponent Na+:H+ antiporter subunit B [Methylocaldum szegediense]
MNGVSSPARWIAGALAWVLGLGLAGTMTALPLPGEGLAPLVQAYLAESGVKHPVTAVLLNYRGYDTLLEIAVLQAAVLGVLAFRPTRPVSLRRTRPDPSPVLRTLTHWIAPLIALTGGYLLWAGAYRPGGAFQAGAVLAGGGVLLRLVGAIPGFRWPSARLRIGLVLGFTVFLAAAAVPLSEGSSLMTYREARAAVSILLIESALTLSIAVVLVTLFIGAAPPRIGCSPRLHAARRWRIQEQDAHHG